MPYEAAVPVHRRLLWPAVTDAERLLGALPNVTIDASGAQGVAGRLRVRTREQTVTFRGVARIVEVVPTALRVSIEVEAVFGRAGGSVEGLVEIVLRKSGSGTRVVVDGQLDITSGAAPLPADSLDVAFRRVVQRWFTVLAETSPAARRERTDDQSAPEPPRTQERASLAVVRDVGQDRPDLPSDSGPAHTAGTASVSSTSTSVPGPAPLRLVTPQPDELPESADDESVPATMPVPVPDDDSDPDFELALAAEFDDDLDLDAADEPEPEDIWSRLRDRSLPPWIPFLVGAATATLAALVVLFMALRRIRRRGGLPRAFSEE